MSKSSTEPNAETRSDVRVVIRICPEVYAYFALKGNQLENRRLPYQQISWEVEQLVRHLSTNARSQSENNFVARVLENAGDGEAMARLNRALDANPQKPETEPLVSEESEGPAANILPFSRPGPMPDLRRMRAALFANLIEDLIEAVAAPRVSEELLQFLDELLLRGATSDEISRMTRLLSRKRKTKLRAPAANPHRKG